MTSSKMGGLSMRTAMRICAMIVLCLNFHGRGLCRTAGPDAAGYTATDQTTYGFQNIVSTGARILAGTDDATAAVNIGFTFSFYGQDYTSVCVSTNGLLAFGACNDDFANVDLSSASPSGDARIAAPFWTDLNFSAAGSDAVYYQVLGVAPQRQFVVQWNSALPLNSSSGTTFQAVLYEGSNLIRFQYLSVGAGANGQIATVGIRDAGGQVNNRVLQWSYNAPVLKDGLALLFSPGGGPVTQYQVTAVVNPAGGGSVAGAGSYPAGSNATLTATANPGYSFLQWSGSLGVTSANPLSFQVNGNKQVAANFVTVVPVVGASVTGKTGDPSARVWTVQLKDTGAGAASDAQLIAITLTLAAGAPACASGPTVVTPLPLDYGTLAPSGGTASRPVTINFGGCQAASRFSVTFRFTANGGTYTGATTLNNQFR